MPREDYIEKPPRADALLPESVWTRWFAWYPVEIEGRVVWLRSIARRRVQPIIVSASGVFARTGPWRYEHRLHPWSRR